MFRGSKFLLLTEKEAPGVFVQVAAVISTGFSIKSNFVDVSGTSKNEWTQRIPGKKKSATVTLAGNFKDTFLFMQQRALDGGPYRYKLQDDSGAYWIGTFLIDQFSISGDLGKLENWNLKLVSTGPVPYIAAPLPDDGPFRITADDFIRCTADGADRIYV